MEPTPMSPAAIQSTWVSRMNSRAAVRFTKAASTFSHRVGALHPDAEEDREHGDEQDTHRGAKIAAVDRGGQHSSAHCEAAAFRCRSRVTPRSESLADRRLGYHEYAGGADQHRYYDVERVWGQREEQDTPEHGSHGGHDGEPEDPISLSFEFAPVAPRAADRAEHKPHRVADVRHDRRKADGEEHGEGRRVPEPTMVLIVPAPIPAAKTAASWSGVIDDKRQHGAPPGRRSRRGYHGEQKVRGMGAARVQRHSIRIPLGRAVVWVVVQERAAAEQLVLEVGKEAAARPRIDVVPASNREREPVARREDDAGWPDLHVDLVNDACHERLGVVMGVVRPVGQGQGRVQLAVRGPQPTLRHRGVRVDCPFEDDLLFLRRKGPGRRGRCRRLSRSTR